MSSLYPAGPLQRAHPRQLCPNGLLQDVLLQENTRLIWTTNLITGRAPRYHEVRRPWALKVSPCYLKALFIRPHVGSSGTGTYANIVPIDLPLECRSSLYPEGPLQEHIYKRDAQEGHQQASVCKNLSLNPCANGSRNGS